MGKIVLFREKKDCCGCGACVNVCPHGAIRMSPDECGFLYPEADPALCVECGACAEVCAFRAAESLALPGKAYAAAARSDEIVKNSASGGAAAVLSRAVLEQGGAVYGAALTDEGEKPAPRHIRVTGEEALEAIQGSKYVQSDIGLVFRQVRDDLLAGRAVLFTGTPCQVAGLKAFLKTDYEKLYTAEIICHGVPSARFFRDFLADWERRLGGTITRFRFRDKSRGQGMTASAEVTFPSGKQDRVVRPGETLSYLCFFLRGLTYRESCYSCPYARPERGADLTLGDFWGFHEEYPEVPEKSGLSNGRGVSCVLVGSRKGAELLERCASRLCLMEADPEKIRRHNAQLCRPSRPAPGREELLGLYRDGGYPAAEAWFQKNFRRDRVKGTLSAMLPKGLKRFLKRAAGRNRGG